MIISLLDPVPTQPDPHEPPASEWLELCVGVEFGSVAMWIPEQLAAQAIAAGAVNVPAAKSSVVGPLWPRGLLPKAHLPAYHRGSSKDAHRDTQWFALDRYPLQSGGALLEGGAMRAMRVVGIDWAMQGALLGRHGDRLSVLALHQYVQHYPACPPNARPNAEAAVHGWLARKAIARQTLVRAVAPVITDLLLPVRSGGFWRIAQSTDRRPYRPPSRTREWRLTRYDDEMLVQSFDVHPTPSAALDAALCWIDPRRLAQVAEGIEAGLHWTGPAMSVAVAAYPDPTWLCDISQRHLCLDRLAARSEGGPVAPKRRARNAARPKGPQVVLSKPSVRAFAYLSDQEIMRALQSARVRGHDGLVMVSEDGLAQVVYQFAAANTSPPTAREWTRPSCVAANEPASQAA